MVEKFLLARTYKKKGSAAIPLEAVDFLTYIPQLEATFKCNAEFLIVSKEAEMAFDEAWPEYAPTEVVDNAASFEKVVEEKTKREKK